MSFVGVALIVGIALADLNLWQLERTRLRSEAASGVIKVRMISSVQWGVRREAAPREYGCKHSYGCSSASR